MSEKHEHLTKDELEFMELDQSERKKQPDKLHVIMMKIAMCDECRKILEEREKS